MKPFNVPPHRRSSLSTLEGACHLAFVVAVLNGVALVVLLLTAGDGDDELRQSFVVDEKARGDDRKAARANGRLQFADFLAVEQQFAVAAGVVVVVRPVEILGDVHVFHPDFALLDDAKRIHQARLSLADGLDFRPGQNDTRRKRVEQLVVERCPFILNRYVLLKFFFHKTTYLMERRHQDDKEIVDSHRRQDEDEGRKGGEFHPHGLVHFHINNRTFPYNIEGVKYKDIEEKEVR